MTRHADIDRSIAVITSVDLGELGRRLHALVELNRTHPSTPDGYPTSTPGAPTPTSRPRTDTDPDDQIALTSVEAATHARRNHHDPLAAAERHATEMLRVAADALTAAGAHLARADQHRTTRPDEGLNPEPGCWAMARIGAWEPVHRTTNLADILAHPLDEPRPLGRWAYDFARRQGRLPTADECRRHRDGKKVMVAA